MAMTAFPVICGASFKNKGVQPLLDAVVDYLPSPLDIPPVTGINPETGADRGARGRRQGAVLGAGVQDHERPARRAAHLPPRVLGHARRRHRASTTPPRTRRSGSAACCGCTPTSARRSRRSAAGDIAAVVGLKRHDHRRHAVRREQADRAGVDDVPGAGHRGRDRAEDQGRPGEARRGAGRGWPWKTRRSGCTTDEETGQTLISGMGELHLEIIVDRMLREFKRGGQRRQAAGRLPRDHPPQGARRRAGSSGRPAAAASTATCTIEVEPLRAGRGLRVREQDHGRRRSRASTCRRSRRACKEAMETRRAGRLPGGRHQGDARSTARTTRWTRPRWRSRSPARWRSRRRAARPGPSCSSR